MIRTARLPEEIGLLREIAERAARWQALEDWEPWAWEPPTPSAGALVFELEGAAVGWCEPGDVLHVAPHAQGAGVEEALLRATTPVATGRDGEGAGC